MGSRIALVAAISLAVACSDDNLGPVDSSPERSSADSTQPPDAGADLREGGSPDTAAPDLLFDQGQPDAPPQGGVTTYGKCQPSDPEALFLSEVPPPAALAVQQTAQVSVTFANCSGVPWLAVPVGAATGHKLGAQAPQDNTTWGFNRVALPADVAHDQQVTVAFSIKAPFTAGSHGYQWAIVQEGVKWITSQMSPVHSITVTGSGPVQICPGVTAAIDGSSSASVQLQQCINATASGGTLELPAGTYLMTTAVSIAKPMTLRTKGTALSKVGCLQTGALPCARLLAAPALDVNDGLFQIALPASNVTVEHIVLDGNRGARLGSTATATCVAGNNRKGFNATARGAGHTFRHNASINTLCGTAMEWNGSNATISDNLFEDNGDNASTMLWADGLTIHVADSSTVSGNILRNNSDVGLILGSAVNSVVTGNVIQQTTQLAFAGLMLDNFNGATPGDFRGTKVSGNTVSCTNLLCDFGINLGPHAWYLSANIIGGEVTGNTVTKAKLGLLVDGAGTAAYPIKVHQNNLSGSPTVAKFSCGKTLATSNYNIGPDSVVDKNGDPTPHTSYTWHQCH